MTKGLVLGMDEVGRGSWAGPVLVGAVILKRPITGLRDSKQLTRTQRGQLYKVILARAILVTIGAASAHEIDELGLTDALKLAYKRAFVQITMPCDQIIIDGNYNFLPDGLPVQTIVKADNLVPAVSAASIIAKVTRDRLMANHAIEFPEYGFQSHVGYGTAAHLAALQLYGPCALHRHSFAPVRAVIEPV